LAGTTSNTELHGTQQQRRHKLVYRHAANEATKHMTQDANLKIVCKTGSSKNRKQHAVGCEYILIVAKGGQLTMSRTAGLSRELSNKFIAVCNRKPPWWTTAFVSTVRELEHHDVISAGLFTDEFPDKHPRE
jgi:hypothetical protein